MAAGEVLTLVCVQWLLGISLPLPWILLPPAIMVSSNIWLSGREGQRGGAAMGWIFVLDALCLTAILMLSGGPNNPFSLLYLVHITLSATILTQRQTWGLGIMSSLCFGALFWYYRPIPALETHHASDGANLHLTGMWIGFTAAAMLVAMFSARISELLRKMQEELARKDRLASLVTLAAGAAHELNTPLGTIAVVAKELELYATNSAPDAAIAEDSRLIRTEVERCRAILQRMSTDGAEPAGEALVLTSALDLVSEAVGNFPPNLVNLQRSSANGCLLAPRHAVEQALVALIKNAIEASGDIAPVEVTLGREGGTARFIVRDSGCGMSPEIIRHAGEPFFTTKAPGKGLGLGIFLVRTLAERLGGHLTIQSHPGKGTTATLHLPLHQSAVEPSAEVLRA